MDASFLHLEDASAHMHVASVMVFEGDPPPYEDLLESIEGRLHLVPRYRQRLAFVPLGQGRPRWVDDPHLNLRYHVRATALPAPGTEDQLRALASRVFAQQLDRDKPLWEIYLVEGLDDGRFALLSKTHHALVDGVSGVDIFTVLFDTSARAGGAAGPRPALAARPRPLRSPAAGRGAAGAGHGARRGGPLGAGAVPRAASDRRQRCRAPPTAWARWRGPGMNPAPPSPYNQPIGPHRRFTWVRTELADIKAIKNELGGTVNDVVLATVSGALGRHLRRRGQRTDGLELKAMVPVSVRADDRARRPGQPGGGDDGPAAGLVPGARGAAGDRARADGRPQGERPGAGRPGAHRARPATPRPRSWRRPRG